MLCGSTEKEGFDDRIGHLETGETLLTTSQMVVLCENTATQGFFKNAK